MATFLRRLVRAQQILMTAVSIGACLLVAGVALPAQTGQYAKTVDIPINGIGTFEGLYADSVGKRLYASRASEVIVIDTVTNTVVGNVADTPGVRGIAIASELRRGFTSNGGERTVSIFDLKTLKTIAKVDSGANNPAAIMYEPKRKEVWAFSPTGTSASQIDGEGTLIASIPLSGKPATGQADISLNRVFVNIEDRHAIDVIDVAAHKVVATWPVAPATSPTGMAIDPVTHRMFVGGGASMVMIDTTTGKVVASAKICTGTATTWYDPGTTLAFAACSDGHITVVKVTGDTLTVAQTMATEPGARAMTGDAMTHKLYVAGSGPRSPHMSVFERK